MGRIIEDKKEVTIQFEMDETTLAWLALEAHNLDQKLNEYIVDVVVKYAKEMNEENIPFKDAEYLPKR